jgi:hypothetical protein
MTETAEMIENLQHEAGLAGDQEMVDMCARVLEAGVKLRDSDTSEPLAAEELKIDAVRYVVACVRSLDATQIEGHIRVGSRRVYAS